MSNAPVCNVNIPEPSPQPVNSPVVIPVANATNVVQVVNALRAAIVAMTNQSPGSAGRTSPNVKITLGKDVTPQRQGGGKNGQGQKSGFQQTQVTVQPIKVYDPNDATKSTFVTVNQITALTMTNPVTGETWVFSAPSSVPGSG